jgi:hypothetical protein
MLVMLDFEASSLSDDSYPIEVGWAAEDGGCEAHLIRPAPDWTDWDPQAEEIHGIARDRLDAEGEPHDAVARRMVEALSGHDLYATAPSWDGKWMSVLLRAAGLPRHALRLRDSDEAHRAAALEILGPALPPDQAEAAAQAVVAAVQERHLGEMPRHRALADAQAELEVWRQVRRQARAWPDRRADEAHRA